MNRKIDISHKTIIFIAVFIFLLWVVLKIIDIILVVFVAFIFMSALYPIVNKMVSIKIPKVIAILITYIIIFSLLGVIVTVGFTPVINETSGLTIKLSETIDFLVKGKFIDENFLQQELGNLSKNIINYTLDIFQAFVAFISVAVIAFYLLLDREKQERRFAALFGTNKQKVQKLVTRIEQKLGGWLRGQVVLSLFIGILTYIGLTLLGVEYALPLAIIAGLTEVIPIIGPIIGGIPAVLIALTVSPIFALIVAGMYFVIQQLESHVVVPQVMKRAVGLNPLIVIIAVSIGGKLLGIGGALLAVPIAVVIEIIAQEVLNWDEIGETGEV